MAVVALDTHAVVKELQAAGFSEAQAEAVTRAVRRAQDVDLSHLATKSDIQGLRMEIDGLRAGTKADLDSLRAGTKADLDSLRAGTKADIDTLRTSTKADIDTLRASTKADIDTLRTSTKADIGSLRAGTKADIAELKADILKWMVGAIGVQTIAILGALVGLARVLKG